jgi:formate dehydrogenase iron-sulfur subunit
MTGKRLMIDTSKCIGCRACQVACQQWHSLPSEDTVFTGSYQNPPDMSAANLTVTKFVETMDTKLNWLFFKDQCRHCDDPPCMEECPLRAIIRQADGVVRIDSSKCFPSRCSTQQEKPCQDECEFDEIPRYKYVKNGSIVVTKMRKCDLCYDRFNHSVLNAQTRKPACQIACPPGAISFGDANPILAEAMNRVSYLKTHGWPNTKLYPGQSGDDATHVIWVLTQNESRYGQED